MCAFTIISSTGEIRLAANSPVLPASVSATNLTEDKTQIKLANRYHISKRIQYIPFLKVNNRFNLMLIMNTVKIKSSQSFAVIL